MTIGEKRNRNKKSAFFTGDPYLAGVSHHLIVPADQLSLGAFKWI